MRRTAVFGFASGALVAVAFAATSFACTSLATLNLSKGTGVVGDPITITGSSFKAATDAAPAPVVALHWNALEGPVVAEAAPDAAGNISASFAVPESQPGTYVVVARQLNEEGKDHYGTPARASFQVLGAGTQPLAAPSVASRPFSTATDDGSGAVTLALGLGALGLVFFGAGFIAVTRVARRKPVPAAVSAQATED